MKNIMWEPTKESFESTALFKFKTAMEIKYNSRFENYLSFWQWSTCHSEKFWSELWDFFGLVGNKGSQILQDPDSFVDSCWFPLGTLNYAENMINLAQKKRSSQATDYDNSPFLIFKAEDQVRFSITFSEFLILVSKSQQAFVKMGLKKGDRVAAMVPNHPATIILMMAATSLGAIWSSGSPDFGVQGVLDRMNQIDPKIFITSDFYIYNGKKINLSEKTAEILRSLPTVKNHIIFRFDQELAPLAQAKNAPPGSPGVSELFDKLIECEEAKPLIFVQTEFNHPLFILFSSGTTGVPKCITHGHGGTLLQHLKEHQLHGDIRPYDQLFYFTTCGWMMWNWLVSGIASGANILLFEGSPFYQEGRTLFQFLEENKCTQFGTSAKFIDTCKKTDLNPGRDFNLTSIRSVFSTGSPLNEDGFDYVYTHINSKVLLGSISGGTDIVSCFVLSNPWTPVIRGEISSAGLALDIDVWDDNQKSIVGEKGELVCKKTFPCKPIYFWNDPTKEKFKKAYFEKFKNIWCHGDYVEKTINGGFIIYGRSDATLNPGGVRIGTAEIYKQVEALDEVMESVVVGQNWNNDVRIVLFVKLRQGLILNANLAEKIKNQIKKNTTPRHVPNKVLQVTEIPRTKSGKIVELAVKQTLQGETVKNVEALANPEALNEYKNRPELKD